ncbi:MAG: hypothetical protein RIT81_10770 [Deltaproteobacteria bacterium]
MRSVSQRIAAIAVMTFFVGAQLGAAAHEEREHTICPEHGERIHAQDHAADSAAVPSWAALPAEEAHADHCVADFSVDASQDDVRPGSSATVAYLGSSATPTAWVAHPIALLRLAPKSSPPIA